MKKVTITTKIVFNGKEYASVEEMPADVRQVYEKAIGSVADAGLDLSSLSKLRTKTKIVFNGQVYSDVNEMPGEVRQAYDRVMAAVDADHNGIPDALEAETSANEPSADHPLSVQPALSPSPSSPTSPDTTLFIAGLVIVLLLVVIIGLLGLLLFGGTLFR